MSKKTRRNSILFLFMKTNFRYVSYSITGDVLACHPWRRRQTSSKASLLKAIAWSKTLHGGGDFDAAVDN